MGSSNIGRALCMARRNFVNIVFFQMSGLTMNVSINISWAEAETEKSRK